MRTVDRCTSPLAECNHGAKVNGDTAEAFPPCWKTNRFEEGKLIAIAA